MSQRVERMAATVKVGQAKGRPMLSWVGKRPLREVRTYPAQMVERFAVDDKASGSVDIDTLFDSGADYVRRRRIDQEA